MSRLLHNKILLPLFLFFIFFIVPVVGVSAVWVQNVGLLPGSATVFGANTPAIDRFMAAALKPAYGNRLGISDGAGDQTEIQAAIDAVNASGIHGDVRLFGSFASSAQINAKDSADVTGPATITLTANNTDSTVDFNNLANTKWSNLDLYRAGVPGGAARVIAIRGTSTSGVILVSNRAWNNTAGSTLNDAIIIYGSAYPHLINVEGYGSAGGIDSSGLRVMSTGQPWVQGGKYVGGANAGGSSRGGQFSNYARGRYESVTWEGGGGGNNSSGISISDASAGEFYNNFVKGGDVGSFNHGWDIKNAASPSIVGGYAIAGNGGTDSHQVEISDAASPHITGLKGVPTKYSQQWLYDDANNGRFQPFAGKPYMLISISIWVSVAHPGETLDIGTSIGGSEVVNNYSIAAGGYVSAQFAKAEVAANAYLYATPSAAIADGDVEVYYDVIVNYADNYGIYMWTKGQPVIDQSSFIVNGASDALRIHADSVTAKDWKVEATHLETLDPVNQRAVYAAAAITNAPITKCTFVGLIINVSSLAKPEIEEIVDTVLTAPAASVTLTVPPGFAELYLEWDNVYGDNAGWQDLRLTFNADGGANYDYSRQLFNAGTNTTNGATFIYMGACGNVGVQNVYSAGKLTIFNRATLQKKLIGSEVQNYQAGASLDDLLGYHLEAKWRNVANEISSITITANVGNYVAGSRFILKGVRT